MPSDKNEKSVREILMARRLARAKGDAVKKKEVVIHFDRVTKTYHLYKDDKSRFLSLFNPKDESRYLGRINANNRLSFKIYKGEAVAFLGQNGAGKTTALKMIAGVTHPSSGMVHVNGRVSALLELKAGFDGRLTGRENIRLRGQALGMTRAQIKKLEPRMIEFAELGVYIDQPMRTYSSGMKARLGFSFAVFIEPEILIIDETLSVGDKKFRKKCIRRMREIIRRENVTVLFVSHSSSIAKEFCTRGIVLDYGIKLFDGPISEAITYYEKTI